jgi:hypothetical protein
MRMHFLKRKFENVCNTTHSRYAWSYLGGDFNMPKWSRLAWPSLAWPSLAWPKLNQTEYFRVELKY